MNSSNISAGRARGTLGHSNLLSCLRLSHLFSSLRTSVPLHGTGQVPGGASVARCPFEASSDAQESYFLLLNVALLVQSSELNA